MKVAVNCQLKLIQVLDRRNDFERKDVEIARATKQEVYRRMKAPSPAESGEAAAGQVRCHSLRMLDLSCVLQGVYRSRWSVSCTDGTKMKRAPLAFEKKRGRTKEKTRAPNVHEHDVEVSRDSGWQMSAYTNMVAAFPAVQDWKEENAYFEVYILVPSTRIRAYRVSWSW